MAEKNKKTTASKRKKAAATTVKKEVVDTGAAQEFVEMMVNKPVSEIETKVDEENNNVIVKAKVENTINEIEVTTTVVEPEQKENGITVAVLEDGNHMTIQDHQDPIDSIDNVDINGVGVPCQSQWVGVVGPNCDDVKAMDNAIGKEFSEGVNKKLCEIITNGKLRSDWSPEMAKDVPAFHNIEAEIEINNMIVDEIANDIDDKVVNQTPDDVDSGLDVPRNEEGWPILPTENVVSFGNIDERVNDKVDSEIRKMVGEMVNAYDEFFENLKGVDDNIENEVEHIKNIVDELTKTEEMSKPQYRYVTSAMGVSYD